MKHNFFITDCTKVRNELTFHQNTRLASVAKSQLLKCMMNSELLCQPWFVK